MECAGLVAPPPKPTTHTGGVSYKGGGRGHVYPVSSVNLTLFETCVCACLCVCALRRSLNEKFFAFVFERAFVCSVMRKSAKSPVKQTQTCASAGAVVRLHHHWVDQQQPFVFTCAGE